MTSEALWSSTPAEVVAMSHGYEKVDRRFREQMAWVVSYLINVHLKQSDRVTPEQLMGGNQQMLTDRDAKADMFKVWWDMVERQRRGEV